MIVPIPDVHAGIGLATALVSLPLVMRLVPMNRFYGVRLPEAFASSRNWYEINAYGGRLLLAFGLFLIAFAYLANDIAPPPTSPWAPVFLLVPLLALIPVVARIRAYARRLPGP
ncbi:MAG TPA: SdpI family protein [Mariprofundaceae bacterium]|nr:SdpI family protein [Mariprofundaceae bacterium]